MAVHALIVDASPIGRRSLKEALSRSRLAEFAVTEADGPEGLRSHFDPDTTDVVFLGVDDRAATGIVFRMVGTLRTMQTRPLCIVLVGSERTLRRLDLVGVDRTLVRPVRAKTLDAHLAPLLAPAGSTP